MKVIRTDRSINYRRRRGILDYKAFVTAATISRFIVDDFIVIIRRRVFIDGVFAILLWQLFIILILFDL